MMLAGQPGVVGALRAGGPVDLGEDLQRGAPLALQRLAEHGLRRAVGVGVGGVERGDPGVEGGAHARDGGVVLDLGAVGDPVAVGDLGDLQAGPAEVTVFHGETLCPPDDVSDELWAGAQAARRAAGGPRRGPPAGRSDLA